MARDDHETLGNLYLGAPLIRGASPSRLLRSFVRAGPVGRFDMKGRAQVKQLGAEAADCRDGGIPIGFDAVSR
jgi:hypothetical protein